jgi:hypothetical protein
MKRLAVLATRTFDKAKATARGDEEGVGVVVIHG